MHPEKREGPLPPRSGVCTWWTEFLAAPVETVICGLFQMETRRESLAPDVMGRHSRPAFMAQMKNICTHIYHLTAQSLCLVIDLYVIACRFEPRYCPTLTPTDQKNLLRLLEVMSNLVSFKLIYCLSSNRATRDEWIQTL